MQPTRILPDLQCSLLCEEIRQEVTGNFFLIGVVNFLRVPQVPVDGHLRGPTRHVQALDARRLAVGRHHGRRVEQSDRRDGPKGCLLRRREPLYADGQFGPEKELQSQQPRHDLTTG